jgi:hypothetical protein
MNNTEKKRQQPKYNHVRNANDMVKIPSIIPTLLLPQRRGREPGLAHFVVAIPKGVSRFPVWRKKPLPTNSACIDILEPKGLSWRD